MLKQFYCQKFGRVLNVNMPSSLSLKIKLISGRNFLGSFEVAGEYIVRKLRISIENKHLG